MNQRDQRLVSLALIGVVAGGAVLFLGYRLFWSPYQEAQGRLSTLQEEVDTKEREQLLFRADKANLAKWNKLSLPPDHDRASSEYAKMLKPLLRECGLSVDDFQGPPPQEGKSLGIQKKPQHVTLPFQVRAKGTVADLAKFLEALQRMPVMHRVKSLVVDRLDAKDRNGKLGVQMVIEAMIVYGANNNLKLAGLETLGPPVTTRNFQEVPLRNPFVGPLPTPPAVVKKAAPEPTPVPEGPDLREFIRIDTIVPATKEAFLRNFLLKTPPIRLRGVPMSGYDTFRIMDEDRTRVLVKGKVLRIDERDIYFQVGEEVFAFHFGQTLAEAMNRPMRESEMDRLELTSLIDPEFAKEEGATSKSKSSKTKKSR